VDTDGDGVPNDIDAFPGDPSEWADTDGDGVGNNADAFDNDPTEWSDRDGDGQGDNSDPYPDDPTNTPEIAPLPQAPRNSTTSLVENSTGVDRIWNVNPDNDLVSVSSAAGVLIQEIPVGDKPWSLAKSPVTNRILVTNKTDATISVIDTDTLTVVQTVALPFHSQPHGIVFNSLGSDYYVVLEATGQVERRSAATHDVIATVQLSGVPRHIAIAYDDSRLLVSNFITPPAPGESTAVVDLLNAGSSTRRQWR